MAVQSFCADFVIAADHPALAGHFPGNPIVPGVVLLDQVASALERHGLRVAGIAETRFRQVLKANEPASLGMQHDGGRVRFQIRHEGGLVASGTLEVAA